MLRKLLRRLLRLPPPEPRLLTLTEICKTYPWADKLREWVVQHGGTIDMWGYDNPDGTRVLRYSINGPGEMLDRMVRAAEIAGNVRVVSADSEDVPSSFKEWADER